MKTINKNSDNDTQEVKKTKTYAFWMSTSSALLLAILQILAIFGIYIETKIVTDIISSVLGVLVVAGILIGPVKTEDEDSDNKKDNEKKK